MGEPTDQHPLRSYFAAMLHEILVGKLGRPYDLDVEAYLGRLLVRFLHSDALYAIHDPSGRALEAVDEMLVEADVRLNATSFDRERAVHKHIADFILFWVGLFPERYGDGDHHSRLLDQMRQARFSYYVVSSFDHGSYAAEASTYRKLSQNFETYATCLRLLRQSFQGFAGEEQRRAA